MNKVNLDRTKLFVSKIAFGCGPLGSNEWGRYDDKDTVNAVAKAYDIGVNYFDTADVYGDGRSEKFVGEFINSTSERIYVATKAGRKINPHEAEGYYDINLMKSYVDRSLQNLNVETIDLLQMHCPPTEVYSNDLTYQMLDYLVTKGKEHGMRDHSEMNGLRVHT